MRMHRTVLREISNRNLDPKVPHVMVKGKLVEKKKLKDVVQTQITDSVTSVSTPAVEQETSIEDTKETTAELPVEEVKKKKAPPKKKKTTDE